MDTAAGALGARHQGRGGPSSFGVPVGLDSSTLTVVAFPVSADHREAPPCVLLLAALVTVQKTIFLVSEPPSNSLSRVGAWHLARC